MTGRCFSWTALPRRHQRRVSNLVPHAGVHSAPNTPAGPADSYIFAPQGHLLSVQPAARLVAVSPGWSPRGGATLNPRRRRAPFLHLGRRPAKNADQHIAESFGSVAPSVIGFAHETNMRDSHAERVASAYVKARE